MSVVLPAPLARRVPSSTPYPTSATVVCSTATRIVPGPTAAIVAVMCFRQIVGCIRPHPTIHSRTSIASAQIFFCGRQGCERRCRPHPSVAYRGGAALAPLPGHSGRWAEHLHKHFTEFGHFSVFAALVFVFFPVNTRTSMADRFLWLRLLLLLPWGLRVRMVAPPHNWPSPLPTSAAAATVALLNLSLASPAVAVAATTNSTSTLAAAAASVS